MKRRFFTVLALIWLPWAAAHAQSATATAPSSNFTAAPLPSLGGNFGDIPVEITSDGETRFEGGVAIAEDNVQVHYKDVSIYSDYAEYNPDTRDVLLKGNVRLYTKDNFFTGQRALYNLETKQFRALEFQGTQYPAYFHALSLRAPSLREFRLHDVDFTTQDSSMPYWKLHARTVRIYPNDRVIFTGASVYVGKVPIFWFPYLYTNINNAGFQFSPGYDSRWGAYILTGYSFPLGPSNNFIGIARLDYRTMRGVGVGFDVLMKYGKNNRSYGKFIAYYAHDMQPSLNFGGSSKTTTTNENRGRITFKQRLFLTEDIYATADINYLSDANFLQDYYPAEFTTDPQPDNHVELTKWNEFYTLGLLTRWQMNNFQEVTERLPELAWDFKQHPIFGSALFYDGTTTVGYLRRAFENTSTFPNYDSGRFDTFHQISLPHTYMGWLSVVPVAGIRGTYYSQSGNIFLPATGQTTNTLQESALPSATPTQSQIANSDPQLNLQGGVFRPVFNTGVEASFKVSRSFEQIQSRAVGLDGVRHIMQPYTNFSYVYNAGPSPDQILQFDREVPSTQLIPLTFPQFTGIDSLDTWSIWRAGVRNRLQTRRDNQTFNWFTIDSFLDYNFINPYTNQTISNFNNQMTFSPVPWMGLRFDSQVPIAANGFTEVNASISYLPVRDLSLSFGDQYINGYEFFPDSNQIYVHAFWHINDNWAVSLYEQYEAQANLLTLQQYMVHRDFSSWVASIGAQVRNNQGGPVEYGLLFTMTLKDAPQVSLPLAFQQGPEGTGSTY